MNPTTVLLAVAAMVAAAAVVAVGLAVLFAIDTTPARAHPRADAGLELLRSRRPQDELESWR